MSQKQNQVTISKIPLLEIKERPFRKDLKSWLPVFISILALVVTIITSIIQFWPYSPTVQGRLVSMSYLSNEYLPFTNKDGTTTNILGNIYLFKTFLTTTHKDIQIKDIEAYIQCDKNKEKFSVPLLKINGGAYTDPINQQIKKINISEDQELFFTASLKQDHSSPYYFGILLNGTIPPCNPFEKLELVFYDFNNKNYNLNIYGKDINPLKLSWII